MQQTKNKYRLVSLISLSIITVAIYVLSQRDGQLELDKKMFQVEDQSKIDRVELASPKGKVTISYDGTSWKVNNTYLADRQLVKVLFATLLQVVPKRPVNENATDSTVSALKAKGTNVSLFAGQELQKTFYAGSNPDRTQTFFQQPNETPYVVAIPGYRVDASQVFELDENGWRDKRVFNFNWRNLKDIALSYTTDARGDFKIELNKKILSIEDVAVADTTRLSRFVDDLYTLAGDQIVQPGVNSSLDSLFKTPPRFQIVIADIALRKFKLEVMSWKSGENQIPGIVNDSLRLLFDKTKIFRIAKTKDYFKKQE